MKIFSRIFLGILLLPSLLLAQVYDYQGAPVIAQFAAIARWNCSKDNIGATLTECLPAQGAGVKAYFAWFTIQSTTATAGQFLIRTGTGTDCGTGTASIYPSDATAVRYTYPGNTSAPLHIVFNFAAPASAANSQVCIICTAINTCTVAMGGLLGL